MLLRQPQARKDLPWVTLRHPLTPIDLILQAARRALSSELEPLLTDLTCTMKSQIFRKWRKLLMTQPLAALSLIENGSEMSALLTRRNWISTARPSRRTLRRRPVASRSSWRARNFLWVWWKTPTTRLCQMVTVSFKFKDLARLSVLKARGSVLPWPTWASPRLTCRLSRKRRALTWLIYSLLLLREVLATKTSTTKTSTSTTWSTRRTRSATLFLTRDFPREFGKNCTKLLTVPTSSSTPLTPETPTVPGLNPLKSISRGTALPSTWYSYSTSVI